MSHVQAHVSSVWWVQRSVQTLRWRREDWEWRVDWRQYFRISQVRKMQTNPMLMRLICRKDGILFLGQKQTEPGGGFLAREAWSGKLSQFNVWSWPLEDYYLENAAECRWYSSLIGWNIILLASDWLIQNNSNLLSLQIRFGWEHGIVGHRILDHGTKGYF